jgi:hypothetical protein
VGRKDHLKVGSSTKSIGLRVLSAQSGGRKRRELRSSNSIKIGKKMKIMSKERTVSRQSKSNSRISKLVKSPYLAEIPKIKS